MVLLCYYATVVIIIQTSNIMAHNPYKKQKTQQSSLSGFFASSKPDTSTTAESSPSKSEYKIFCDLDGVLVDFDAGVKKLFNGRSPGEHVHVVFSFNISNIMMEKNVILYVYLIAHT